MKINISGSVLGSSGYSNHTRSLARALSKYADVAIEAPLMPGWETICPSDLRLMVEKQHQYEPTIVVAQPHYWNFKVSDRPKKMIPYVIFEGDKIPSSWFEACTDPKIDTILVPSKHVYDAIQVTGKSNAYFEQLLPEVNKKLHIVPHGVNTEIFKPADMTVDKKKFTFLFVGGWSQGMHDRKDLGLLLRAFSETFSKDEPVRLLVKINAAYNGPGWNLQNELNKLGLKDQTEWAETLFTLTDLNEKQLANVYQSADVFVCPSRAEAFGLTFLESMSCGTACISSACGGQTEFINDTNGWIVTEGKWSPSKDQEMFYRGINWWDTDIEVLKKQLRYCFQHQIEVKQKGQLASEEAKKWTWDETAKKIIKIIES